MQKIIILLQVLVLRVPSMVVSFPSRRRIILVEDDNGDNKIIIMTMPLMEMLPTICFCLRNYKVITTLIKQTSGKTASD